MKHHITIFEAADHEDVSLRRKHTTVVDAFRIVASCHVNFGVQWATSDPGSQFSLPANSRYTFMHSAILDDGECIT